MVAKWVSQSLRPFSIVEDPGLINFVEFLCTVKGRYQMKGRMSTGDYAAKLSKGVQRTIKDLIRDKALYVTVTTDMWTSPSNSSFIAVTLHYLTPEFKMRNLTLEVSPFHGTHTGENIKNFLEGVFEKWGISKENIVILF